jgi:hypothetical protein
MAVLKDVATRINTDIETRSVDNVSAHLAVPGLPDVNGMEKEFAKPQKKDGVNVERS